MQNRTRRAVFLDRDGTLNEEVNYLYRVEDFVWIEGAPEAIRRLNEAGLVVIVVTNQAGVAHGLYSERDIEYLHAHIQNELAQRQAHVDAFYFSPFHPQGKVADYRRDSDCRKPGTALIERSANEWNVDLARSFMVGDKESDIQAGQRMGLTTVLVETGYGITIKNQTRADFVEKDINAAVSRILEICTTTP